MDLLRDLLIRAGARGAVLAQTAIPPDRGARLTGRNLLTVHAVLEGETWFERDGSDPVRLSAGTLMLVPRGTPYRIVPFPGAPALDRDDSFDLDGHDHDPDPAGARLLSGAYTMQAPLSHLLLSALAPLVPIKDAGAGSRLALTLGLIADELADPRPDHQRVLDQWLGVLLALSLRAWFARPDMTLPGWLRALEDPVVGPAIHAIQGDLARNWTVEELAALASVPPARFSRRFREMVGCSPAASLTAWRLTLAAQMLSDEPDAELAAVATHVGYRSENAFNTAFRRHFGEPPGRWRNRVTRLGSDP